MNVQELNEYLFQYTDSEKKHKMTGPAVLSPRYHAIPRIPFQDREVYLFSFNKLLRDKLVCVHKESRFTDIPEHIHTVIEFVYVYSGSCTQEVNGRPIKMNQGDICMLDTNIPHSIQSLGERDIIITIEMRREYLTQGFLFRLGDCGIINHFLINTLSLDAAHDQYLIFRKQEENQIHSMIQNILCEYYSPGFCSDKIIDAYMILLFCEILRQYKDQQLSYGKNDGRTIMEILGYIESHYLTATLQDTAEHFGFHPNYLSNYIKKTVGHSFKELIIQQRMNQACFYLSNTDMPIYEIANKIGYNNLGFFYKKFESLYKMPPSLYRRLKSAPLA